MSENFEARLEGDYENTPPLRNGLDTSTSSTMSKNSEARLEGDKENTPPLREGLDTSTSPTMNVNFEARLECDTENTPSLSKPTWDFLNENFTKTELQKHGRNLGLNKIWVTKDKLIEMILHKSQDPILQTPRPVSGTPPTTQSDSSSPTPPPPTPLQQHSNSSPPTSPTLPTPQSSSLPPPPLLPQLSHSSPPSPSTHPSPSHSPAIIASSQEISRQDSVTTPLQLPSSHTSHSRLTDTTTHDNASAISRMTLDIEKIKEKLEIKDMEIELLNTEIKTAYSLVDQLQQKVHDLENQIANKQNSNQLQETTNISTNDSQSILLLGDESLTQTKVSDVNKSVTIRTIKGANVDLLRCWVAEKLTWNPTKCIIYCGLHDIDNTSPDKILDDFDSLISELKEKNYGMCIHICQIVPTLLSEDTQAKIGDFNEHLRIWSESNCIPIIKTDSNFRLGTGEVDDMCYDMESDTPGSTLNRLGIIRLLSTITKQCPASNICKNIDNIKKQTLMTPPSQGPSTNQHQRNTSFSSTNINSYNHKDKPSTRRGFANNQTPNTWVEVTKRNTAHTPTSYSPTMPRERRVMHRNTQHSHYNIPTHNRFDRLQETYDDSHNINNYNYPTHRHNGNYSKKVGCYNCGEFNHIRSSCRFDHKLQCGICQSLGHKSRLCRYYSA